MPVLHAEAGEEVFLQGNFINVGVNASGSLGTAQAAPAGFTTDTAHSFDRLGLFADTDGFGEGSEPTFRDATLPGTPVEGFSVGYSDEGVRSIFTNKERTGLQQIAGEGEDISSGGIGRALWTGTAAETLSVRQTITVSEDGNYVRVDIVLTNVSDDMLTDVRYMRNVDPDQAPGFTTDNEVLRQGEGGALIASYVPGGTFPFFYYSPDARAVVSNYGFQNNDPYEPPAFDAPQPVGFTSTGDSGINITFGLGNLGAGESATFTFYMGLTDDLDQVISSIVPDLEENEPPVANGDAFVIPVDTAITGNVLANDSDPDLDPLGATLVTDVASGTLTLAADGSFTYTPDAGFVGTDSFTYRASDGKASSEATVTITVTGDVPPSDCPTVDREGTQDGSSPGDQVLTGPAYRNTFYFGNGGDAGDDRITNFGSNDILVTDLALRDANGDGIIGFGRNGRLDLSGDGGIVWIDGVSSLRVLGEACDGNHVYAAAYVRPDGAHEGKVLADDALAGDAGGAVTDIFFFDTALDIDLGADTISAFGENDILVTTTRIYDRNDDGVVGFGADRVLDLPGAVDGPGAPGGGGTVAITDLSGNVVSSLEYDGSVVRDGVTYYVYSLVGSSIGIDALAE